MVDVLMEPVYRLNSNYTISWKPTTNGERFYGRKQLFPNLKCESTWILQWWHISVRIISVLLFNLAICGHFYIIFFGFHSIGIPFHGWWKFVRISQCTVETASALHRFGHCFQFVDTLESIHDSFIFCSRFESLLVATGDESGAHVGGGGGGGCTLIRRVECKT